MSNCLAVEDHKVRMSLRHPDREGCRSIPAIRLRPPLDDDRHSLGRTGRVGNAATCNRPPRQGVHRYAARHRPRRKSHNKAAARTTSTAPVLAAGKAAVGSIVCRFEKCLSSPYRGALNQIGMTQSRWRALHRRPRAIAAEHRTRQAPPDLSSILSLAWITITNPTATFRRSIFPVLIAVDHFLVPATHPYRLKWSRQRAMKVVFDALVVGPRYRSLCQGFPPSNLLKISNRRSRLRRRRPPGRRHRGGRPSLAVFYPDATCCLVQ
jgi:hypothetical protein